MSVLVVLFSLVLIAVPVGMILKRLGYHPALALLSVVPVVNIAALWMLATRRWPALPDHRETFR